VLEGPEHTGGNKRRAIELLGISPETFYRRLEAWGLHRRDDDQG
jgi:DNA-binding NtrC family response regulator